MKIVTDIGDNSKVTYIENWLSDEEATKLFNFCKGMEWRQERYNAKVLVPRLTAFIADVGVNYRYSGLLHKGEGFTIFWRELLNKLDEDWKTRYHNSILFNCYRNENDSIGLHSDDEPELGENPQVITLSLGETRQLEMQHKTSRSFPGKFGNLYFDLAHGSLFIMEGECQKHWKHGIKKAASPKGMRISLTFRMMKKDETR